MMSWVSYHFGCTNIKQLNEMFMFIKTAVKKSLYAQKLMQKNADFPSVIQSRD